MCKIGYLLTNLFNKTPYELLFGRKPFIGFLKPFGCTCTVLNTRDKLSKFESKSLEGFFVGYSSHSKAYRVLMKHNMTVEESIHVTFSEHTFNEVKGPDWLFDVDSWTNSFVPKDYYSFACDDPISESLKKLKT